MPFFAFFENETPTQNVPEPLERPLLCTLDKTPQAEAASAHACSISIALVRFSPHSHSSLAPHGSLAQLATMFEASSLPKVIRSLSLYSPVGQLNLPHRYNLSPRLRTRLVGEIGYQGYPPHQNVRSSGLHSGINSYKRKARAFARAAP